MSPLAWVALVAAGALGAPARYLIDGAVQDRTRGVFPWGTFVVNVSGSLLFGFITGLALHHAFPRTPRVVLGTGNLRRQLQVHQREQVPPGLHLRLVGSAPPGSPLSGFRRG